MGTLSSVNRMHLCYHVTTEAQFLECFTDPFWLILWTNHDVAIVTIVYFIFRLINQQSVYGILEKIKYDFNYILPFQLSGYKTKTFI